MTHGGSGSAQGFTLIEVMVSMTLCVILAMAGTTAYFKVLKLVNRAEARIAMHADAQVLYGTLHRQFCAAEQHCAMVFESVAGNGTGSSSDPGSVTFIFMHGKENNEDWQWGAQQQDQNADLVWEKWTWRAASQTLWNGLSTPRRTVSQGTSFKPFGSIDFVNSSFVYLPQPRRYLLPSLPEYTLNDNTLFPASTTPVYPMTSVANAKDYGDMQDLDNNLAAVLPHVSACNLQIVEMGGTVLNVTDSSTATTVLQGAWMDGRLAATLTAPQDFASSDLATRPRLIRFQYTMTDASTQLTQDFSFSFALPGLSGPP